MRSVLKKPTRKVAQACGLGKAKKGMKGVGI
jgi:hypothetical protein